MKLSVVVVVTMSYILPLNVSGQRFYKRQNDCTCGDIVNVTSTISSDTPSSTPTNSPNDFVCIDDTNFKHFITSTEFVIEACGAPGLCFTRKPPNKNPCIGARALEIDNHH